MNDFLVVGWLNNYMLDIMDDTTNIRIGRGCPIDNDGLWLSGNNPPTRGTYNEGESKHLAQEFGERRTLLANHLFKVFVCICECIPATLALFSRSSPCIRYGWPDATFAAARSSLTF